MTDKVLFDHWNRVLDKAGLQEDRAHGKLVDYVGSRYWVLDKGVSITQGDYRKRTKYGKPLKQFQAGLPRAIGRPGQRVNRTEPFYVTATHGLTPCSRCERLCASSDFASRGSGRKSSWCKPCDVARVLTNRRKRGA